MKHIELEYGQGMMGVSLPDSTEVFVPGETVPDPPYLEDVEAATRRALEQPLGLAPIDQLVGPGSRVTISFPDRVKGGYQPTSHRKIAIPKIIEACMAAGVRADDILLICSNGLHRKNTPDEIRDILGPAIFDRFHPTGQIVNHDSEDRDNLVDLGRDAMGNRVLMNKEVFESDLPVLIGHVLGNPYGGYSGGYKMAATGITTWESIAAHHIPGVMHRPDFTPVSSHSDMRTRMDSIGQHMEASMGRPFFLCDAVLDSQQRQIAVFCGAGESVQTASWQVADLRTYVPWAHSKFSVMVFGMPQSFHYGDGHGTNPILMLQAVAANVIRHRRVLEDHFVVICASICNGYFNDEAFPSYRELFERFQGDYQNILPDLAQHAQTFCANPEYIDRYRNGYGYHPYHAFSMVSCGHIAEREAAAIYVIGAEKPGYARAMGMKTRATFEEALDDAAKIVGSTPKILALPRAFRTAAVHLTMHDDGYP
jgi:hypothetical protein